MSDPIGALAGAHVIAPLPERRAKALIERDLAPANSWCAICGRPWEFVKLRAIDVRDNPGASVFLTCEDCWAIAPWGVREVIENLAQEYGDRDGHVSYAYCQREIYIAFEKAMGAH